MVRVTDKLGAQGKKVKKTGDLEVYCFFVPLGLLTINVATCHALNNRFFPKNLRLCLVLGKCERNKIKRKSENKEKKRFKVNKLFLDATSNSFNLF